MSTKFIDLQKYRIETEQAIRNINYENGEYRLTLDSKDFSNQYKQIQQKLNINFELIMKRITGLKSQIMTLKQDMTNTQSQNQKNQSLEIRKLNAETEKVQQIEILLRKQTKDLLDQLQTVNQQYNLFGRTGKSNDDQDPDQQSIQILNDEYREIKKANKHMEDMDKTSRDILGAFRNQENILQRSQKYIKQILSFSVVSNRLIRLIRQRSSSDKCLLFFLTFLLIIFIVFVKYWVNPYIKSFF